MNEDDGGSSWEQVLPLTEENDHPLSLSEEETVSRMLKNLIAREAAFIRDALFQGGSVVAWKLKDLSTESIPCKQAIDHGKCPEQTLYRTKTQIT